MKIILIATASFAFTLILALFWINRFEYIRVEGEAVYKINRWTGSITLIDGTEYFDVVQHNPFMKLPNVKK